MQKAKQIVALVRSNDLGRDLISALNSNDIASVDVQVGALNALTLPTFKNGSAPDAVIVDVDVSDPDDADALKKLTNLRNGSNVPLVATSKSIAPMDLRRLLLEGVDDFFPQPVTSREVLDALHTAIARHELAVVRHAPTEGEVISFIRAAGGMGSTTLAINTAHQLIEMSAEKSTRVCLLDLDPQFGNVALYLDIAQNNGVVDIIRSPARLDGDLLRGAMVRHRSGVYVLTAPTFPMPLDALQPDFIETIIAVAKREFDFIVVDLPRTLTAWTEAVLTASSKLPLVVQLTVPALRQTRRLLDMLQEEGHYALPLAVVVNRYARKWNDFFGPKEAERALGRKVDHIVANDFDLISRAVNEGLPASAINKRSLFCRSVRQMTEAFAADCMANRTATPHFARVEGR